MYAHYTCRTHSFYRRIATEVERTENVNCPKCGAEFGIPHIVSKTDTINEFGRRVLDFKAEQESYITYDKGKYYCSKCGHEFTEKEAYFQ